MHNKTPWMAAMYSFTIVYSYIHIFCYLAIAKTHIDFTWPIGRVDSIEILKAISLIYILILPFVIRKIVKTDNGQ